MPWNRKWQPITVFLPRKFCAQRSLVGCTPLGHKELDMTKHTQEPCFICISSLTVMRGCMGFIDLVAIQSLSCVQLFATPWTTAHQALLSFTLSQVCSNTCPLRWWCHPTISSSAVPFSSCLQSFPALGSSPVNQLFASSGQNIGASSSASVLPKNIQGWFPLWLTGLISWPS